MNEWEKLGIPVPRNLIDMVKSGTGQDYRLVIDFERPRIALMTGPQEPFWENIVSTQTNLVFLKELKRNLDVCLAKIEEEK